MGDAAAGDPQERLEADAQGSSGLARGCLAVALVAIFVIVLAPPLLWAAGILIAGGR